METHQGFEEFDHTADWGIHVWSPTLEGLLETAARGMLGLLMVEVDSSRSGTAEIPLLLDLEPEVLLVSFLEEVLYLSELHGVIFEQFEFRSDGESPRVFLSGRGFKSQKKEIKAVTFHNLAIQKTTRGYEATIVFDV